MPMLGKKANIQTMASLLGNMPMVFWYYHCLVHVI
jgi:hypothetical protein